MPLSNKELREKFLKTTPRPFPNKEVEDLVEHITYWWLKELETHNTAIIEEVEKMKKPEQAHWKIKEYEMTELAQINGYNQAVLDVVSLLKSNIDK